ncbi:hypothetical protein MALL_0093, partial [Mycoplasmopsis alligatoris A21JP2]
MNKKKKIKILTLATSAIILPFFTVSCNALISNLIKNNTNKTEENTENKVDPNKDIILNKDDTKPKNIDKNGFVDLEPVSPENTINFKDTPSDIEVEKIPDNTDKIPNNNPEKEPISSPEKPDVSTDPKTPEPNNKPVPADNQKDPKKPIDLIKTVPVTTTLTIPNDLKTLELRSEFKNLYSGSITKENFHLVFKVDDKLLASKDIKIALDPEDINTIYLIDKYTFIGKYSFKNKIESLVNEALPSLKLEDYLIFDKELQSRLKFSDFIERTNLYSLKKYRYFDYEYEKGFIKLLFKGKLLKVLKAQPSGWLDEKTPISEINKKTIDYYLNNPFEIIRLKDSNVIPSVDDKIEDFYDFRKFNNIHFTMEITSKNYDAQTAQFKLKLHFGDKIIESSEHELKYLKKMNVFEKNLYLFKEADPKKLNDSHFETKETNNLILLRYLGVLNTIDETYFDTGLNQLSAADFVKNPLLMQYYIFPKDLLATYKRFFDLYYYDVKNSNDSLTFKVGIVAKNNPNLRAHTNAITLNGIKSTLKSLLTKDKIYISANNDPILSTKQNDYNADFYLDEISEDKFLNSRVFKLLNGTATVLSKVSSDPNDLRFYVITNQHVVKHQPGTKYKSDILMPRKNITLEEGDYNFNDYTIANLDFEVVWNLYGDNDLNISVVDLKEPLKRLKNQGNLLAYNWLNNWKNLKDLEIFDNDKINDTELKVDYKF